MSQYKIGQSQSHTPAPADGASIRVPINVTASTTSGVIGYSRNPQRAGVIAQITRIHITNPSNVACDLDIGTAATKVLSDNLIDGIGVNIPINSVYDNIDDGGSNGKTRQYVGAGGFFTVAVASGDANGLQADVYFNYQILEGGSTSL